MNIFQAIFLGIVQGITEFLPISSSAHLVIFPYLFGWKFPADQNFSFGVIVQMGTLVSLIIYFRDDIWSIIKSVFEGIWQRKPFGTEKSRLGWYVLLATFPAGLTGLLLKSKVEEAFGSPIITALFLFGTAFLLILAEMIGNKTRSLSEMNWKNAVGIGLFQAISIFPGISRSGSCLSGGIIQNYERKDAARFSFLMAIPIMLAAGLIGFLDLIKVKGLIQFLPVVLAGTIVAGVVGYLVITWMLNFLNHHSLNVFAIYCVLLGILVLAVQFIFPTKVVLASSQGDNEIVEIGLPSSLSWTIPIIDKCNQTTLNSPVVFRDLTDHPSDKQTIVIQTRRINDKDKKFFVLHQEPNNVIVNQSNPFSQMDISIIKDIFSGKISSWQDLVLKCTSCIEKNVAKSIPQNSIQAWVYIPGSTSQKIVSDLFFLGEIFSPSVNIAPDEKSMAEALGLNPSAIGFLPNHWLNAQIKIIKITGISALSPTSPILASVNSSEIQKFTPFVACIQSQIG